MKLKTETLDKFHNHSNLSYVAIRDRDEYDVLLNYIGEFEEPFSSSLSSRLERIIAEKIESRQSIKRFFSVFVEAIQNIRLHGITDSKDEVHAGIIVYKSSTQLKANLLNIVSARQAEHLLAKYDEVNAMDRKDLKKMYMDVMMHGELSNKGGAGLGIITIVLRSKNPCLCKVYPLTDEYKIFESSISVDL
ncbi:MAG: SiaB family protein kinase [Cryomorphaceae bacterium]